MERDLEGTASNQAATVSTASLQRKLYEISRALKLRMVIRTWWSCLSLRTRQCLFQVWRHFRWIGEQVFRRPFTVWTYLITREGRAYPRLDGTIRSPKVLETRDLWFITAASSRNASSQLVNSSSPKGHKKTLSLQRPGSFLQ